MAKPPSDKDSQKDALRRLGNPYAQLQLIDNVSEWARILENPYAKEQMQFADHQEEVLVSPRGAIDETSVTQREFESECRRIFRLYIPAVEKGRIRDHHRAFIDRNRSRSAVQRSRLLGQLRKYDLGGIQGLKAQFNRERDALTAEKLAKIERDVIGVKS